MKRILKHPKVQKHAKQFMKFCMAGLIGASLEFSIITLLVKVYGFDPQVAYLPSGLTALMVVFFFNKYITFGNREKKAARQSMKFAIVYGMAFAINYTIASGLYFLGKQYVPLPELELAIGAKALAIGVTAFWNYFFSSGFIFKHSKQTDMGLAVSTAV